MAITSQMRIFRDRAVYTHWLAVVPGLHNTFAGAAMMPYWWPGWFDLNRAPLAPFFLTITK